ncbi:MAG: tRNA (adenosine(37)-N6)-threonylcarbamoyltransferase complex dimerization subunit type 1 TsaB [Pseudomonadales bacterium]|nr:tRNA (adenosine(37)-N6)-threonylcarbamoyltransferase complex dimerization subunit type 1 TsaB [Pseudomonadales bacterium]
MSNILAIDTSNAYCSVALNCSGQTSARRSSEVRQHARQLLPMIQELLTERALSVAELQAIAFVSGPGSFTGLRIGTGVVQGLAFASDLPVVPVSSLAVMAASALQEKACKRVFVALQAREDEIYGALYESVNGDVVLLGEEGVGPVSAFLSSLRALNVEDCLAGDVETVLNAVQGTETLSPEVGEVRDCASDAQMLSQLAALRFAKGMAVEPMQAEPVYVKEQMDYRE